MSRRRLRIRGGGHIRISRRRLRTRVSRPESTEAPAPVESVGADSVPVDPGGNSQATENIRQLLMRVVEICDQHMLEREPALTGSEADVLSIMKKARKPESTAAVQKLAARGSSLSSYRRHVSAVLNSLVARGLLGKVPGSGDEVSFALPSEAIVLALDRLGQTPDDCDYDDIRDVTGMPSRTVLEIVDHLRNM